MLTGCAFSKAADMSAAPRLAPGCCLGNLGKADFLSDLGLPTCFKPPQTWLVKAFVWRVVLLLARMTLCLLAGWLEPMGCLIMRLLAAFTVAAGICAEMMGWHGGLNLLECPKYLTVMPPLTKVLWLLYSVPVKA